MKKTAYAGFIRQVIEKHLNDLEHYQKIALADEDPEGVHQARVGSRRLRNAFWIFKGILPSGPIKVYGSFLRVLTKDMGEARDLDAMLIFLEGLAKGQEKMTHRESIKKIIEAVIGDRSECQKQVVEALEALEINRVLPDIRKMLETIDRVSGEKCEVLDIKGISEKKILKRLDRFLEHEKYVKIPFDVKGLHKMRIAAKKLRYTLENLRPVYGKTIEEYIDVVKNIQRALGRIHDLDVWSVRISGYISSVYQGDPDDIYDFSGNFKRMRSERYLGFVNIWESSCRKRVWTKLKRYISE